MARGDPVPLDLLVRSNLVQQELTRLGLNSIAVLNRTVNVAPDVMWKLRDLLDREVDRHDREWMETIQQLTVTERTEKRQVTIRSRDVEQDCRSIVNQLVTSMPKDDLLRTSFTEHRTSTHVQATEEVRVKSKSSFTRKIHFTDAREEYEPSSDCSSGEETLCGDLGTFEPGQDDLSGETMLGQPKDRILSGEPGSRRPRDKIFLESRETSHTDRNTRMWNPLARVMCPLPTRGLSRGKTHRRLLPSRMFRRLQFIPCWWNGNSAGWTGKCIRIRTETGIPLMRRAL